MEHFNLARRLCLAASTFPDTAPPEYPGLTLEFRPSVFRIPTFDEAIGPHDLEDSLRLPTYQARQLRRYHPYQRFRGNTQPEDDIDRYVNTIYDDEYVPLEMPSSTGPVQPGLFQQVIEALQATLAAEHVDGEAAQSGEIHEENRFHTAIVDLLLATITILPIDESRALATQSDTSQGSNAETEDNGLPTN